MGKSKLISFRGDRRVIESIDQMCVRNHYRTRSYYLNRIIQFGMALIESNQGEIIENFWYSRGDKIKIHDYDIEKGDGSNLKNE